MSSNREVIKSNIKKYGVHIIHVLEEGDEPNFSYTIGLFESFQLPEMIIIGLDQEIQHTLLNNIAYDYKHGRKFVNGQLYDDILDDYKCMLIALDAKFYEEYLGQAIDYYQSYEFPVMQIIWPTKTNVFPYEKEAPEGFKKWQPVLGKVKKTK